MMNLCEQLITAGTIRLLWKSIDANRGGIESICRDIVAFFGLYSFV